MFDLELLMTYAWHFISSMHVLAIDSSIYYIYKATSRFEPQTIWWINIESFVVCFFDLYVVLISIISVNPYNINMSKMHYPLIMLNHILLFSNTSHPTLIYPLHLTLLPGSTERTRIFIRSFKHAENYFKQIGFVLSLEVLYTLHALFLVGDPLETKKSNCVLPSLCSGSFCLMSYKKMRMSHRNKFSNQQLRLNWDLCVAKL